MNNRYVSCVLIVCALALLLQINAVHQSEKSNAPLEDEQLRCMIIHRVPYSQDIQHTLDIICEGVQASEDSLIVLKKMEKLDLSCTAIKDITPLAYLTNLEELRLRGNELKDITPVGRLGKLKVLDLNDNLIENIDSIIHLKKLRSLDLGNNEIADIEVLSELENIQDLNLFCNKIVDIAPLANLKKLETLDLYGNTIKNTTPLAGLSKLKMHDVQTSFEIACRNGFVKKAHVLISMHGANCNFQDAGGGTPLMIASEFGQEDIVDLLLKNYANLMNS